MTDMLTGTMMEELATIITCVTGDARHRRTVYEADQDFDRFGKTLIANFKDTATLWEFLRKPTSVPYPQAIKGREGQGSMGKG
jgi:hypothetical protein